MQVAPNPTMVTSYQMKFKFNENDSEIDKSPDRRFNKVRDEMVLFSEAFMKAKNMTSAK